MSDGWRTVGLLLGYPECCVEAFCRLTHMTGEGDRDSQVKAANGTGFIPCTACAHKVNSGQATLSGLITNRKVWSPFPIAQPAEIHNALLAIG